MVDLKQIVFAALSVVLLLSALAVIFSKYQTRRIFTEIQKMEKQLDFYEVEWGRLQLEMTMLTEENRVEIEARNRLKLIMPERDKIVYLKP